MKDNHDESNESPQERWNRKNGYTTMGIRLYKTEADEFRKVCVARGVTVSGQIRKMMKDFVNSHD